VTLIESPDIPVVGVGEATTNLMPPFLHATLGIDPARFFAAVRPTFKLGIRFEWGRPAPHSFTYPFGDADPIEAFHFDGHLGEQSWLSMLMERGAAPLVRGPTGDVLSFLPRVKFAYHLDNVPLVQFLKSEAEAHDRISRVDATIEEVETGPEGVRTLIADDGRRLSFDLYVDATGFRSLLVGDALGSPFRSYADRLLCDRAVVASVPAVEIDPYTTAETFSAGWCWRIPVRGEDHRGYVYSSQHLDDDRAIDELRAREPSMGPPRVISFRSGRHVQFWDRNVVAIGNAYGFVEPLESTALHMAIVQIAYLLAGLHAGGGTEWKAHANAAVGGHWDYLASFLALHYRYNHRLDTPFWRDARAAAEIGSLEHVERRYQEEGPFMGAEGLPPAARDPAFGFSGLMMVLLGQEVPPGPITPVIDRAQWEDRRAGQRRLAEWSLPQREALAVLDQRPDLLAGLAGRRSWVMDEAEQMRVRLRHGGKGKVHLVVRPRERGRALRMSSSGAAGDNLLRALRPARGGQTRRR
jgi:tryptophan halogenase